MQESNSTKYTLVTTQRFSNDLDKVTAWYELQQKGLSAKFLIKVENLLEFIQTYPLSCQAHKRNYRGCFISLYPYVIMYKIEKQSIIVTRILGTKEHPTKRNK